MSGLDFRKQLQTALHRIAIIFTTGLGDVPMIVKTMRFGVLEFRTMPFDGKKLRRKLRVPGFQL